MPEAASARPQAERRCPTDYIRPDPDLLARFVSGRRGKTPLMPGDGLRLPRPETDTAGSPDGGSQLDERACISTR